jgi:multiple sugar transport system permease protein
MAAQSRTSLKPSQLMIWVLLATVTAITLLPLIWALKSVFTPNGEIFSTSFFSMPSRFTLGNISRGWGAARFGLYFKNSLIVGSLVTVSVVVTSALAGYGFAKFKFRGQKFLFAIVIATMLMPFQAILIPLFAEVKIFGWIDSLKGLIIPGSVSAFGIFMMRQFMSGIPNELIEAALIDGCSALKVFTKVVLPIARSPLAALGALAFLASWNNYLWPLVVVQSEETMTIPLGLSQFRGSNATDYGAVFAVSLIAALPVILLFIFMSRKIVSSFAMSGIK